MASRKTFFTTDPALAPILDELRPLEPIFHTPDFGLEPTDFERRTAPDYWEVGASGRRYSRDFILQTLADSPPVNAASVGWRASANSLPTPTSSPTPSANPTASPAAPPSGSEPSPAGKSSTTRAPSSPPTKTTSPLHP